MRWSIEGEALEASGGVWVAKEAVAGAGERKPEEREEFGGKEGKSSGA